MIILEAAEPRSAVDTALIALVEAAVASDERYTTEDLEALVAGASTAVALNELGGLGSWIKRFYTGANHNEVLKAEREISMIKTEGQKRKLLAEIDKLIKEAEYRKESGVAGRFVKGFLLGYMASPIPGSALASGVAKAAMHDKGNIEAYIDALKAVRAKVEAVRPEG